MNQPRAALFLLTVGIAAAAAAVPHLQARQANQCTRLGLTSVIIWHNADHYGQMTLYLRENGNRAACQPPAAS